VSPDDKLANYITAINHDSFDVEQQSHIYANKEYSSLRPLSSRLFSAPATSAPVETSRAKMSDDLLEMLVYFSLQC